jgi:hypothetical protein
LNVCNWMRTFGLGGAVAATDPRLPLSFALPMAAMPRYRPFSLAQWVAVTGHKQPLVAALNSGCRRTMAGLPLVDEVIQ